MGSGDGDGDGDTNTREQSTSSNGDSASPDSETDPSTENPANSNPETESSNTETLEFSDYYELLGITEDATRAEITRAYREMAKRTHPDGSDLPEKQAETQFRRVLAARDVLTSAETRRAYDALGHDEFCRQSDALGEHISRPAETDDEPGVGPGRAQRSARGEAARRGDPLVPPVDSALFDSPPETATDGETETEGRGRGIYRFVFDETAFESTSLDTVARRWRAAWRSRIAAAVIVPATVFVLLLVMESLLASTGQTVSRPTLTPVQFAVLGIVSAVGVTVYGCLLTERALPRGAFVADRAVGRFAADRSQRYRRRGALLLGAVFALVASTANADANPWTHTAETLRGDATGFPWFTPETAGLSESALLDGVLTAGFGLAAFAGVCMFVIGVSATLWRARYERGSRIRPTLWEPVLVTALISTPVALVIGAVSLVTVPGLESLPATAQTALALENGSVTVGTIAVGATALSVLLWPVVHLRLRLLD